MTVAEGDYFSRALFVLCGAGLNVAPAIYFAYINVYALTLPRLVLAWMSLTMLASAFIVVIFQVKFDAFFDRTFGTGVTYPFRVGFGLLGLGIMLLIIPYAVDLSQVLTLGVCIGVFVGFTIASLNQMASVAHTTFTKYVATGMTIGQGLPIPLSLCLDFGSANASDETRRMFAWLPASFCFLTFTVFIFAAFQGIFNAAFISMDETQSIDEDGEDESRRLIGGSSQETPRETQQPSEWLLWPTLGCAVMQVVGNFLASTLVPFFAYAGSLRLAHELILVRFGGELLGRVASHYLRLWDWGLLNEKGLKLLLAVTCTRAVLLLMLTWVCIGPEIKVSKLLLYAIVGFYYCSYAWGHSELNVLVCQFGPKHKKIDFMRGMTLFMLSGQAFGAVTALAILLEFPVT